ncbi:DNA-3-methyladenine glycosylase 2 family protein [Ereboglobus luteus]|uniref:DNA-3-methyladenine glycosylase II n=1 Tax=Ereboglobus luteus TaxID=1796921 RepID=A0A2U8E3P6_9BACT|nr:AlkA N-terminal domain-containing protein [Ereboglobus luteus]AWI09410.1 adenosine deaminase [Ereboglobus luteus]
MRTHSQTPSEKSDPQESRVWYEAFKRKDSRFDGRFFVGVLSTGVYCRPVCRARLPRAANCTFYDTAAEAERAGFRPCLLCRPELAPGNAPVDAKAALVYRAAKLMEENCAHGDVVREIAKRLGCTDRHLRRAFLEKFRVTPVEYMQTCRLLLAKNLLTSTTLSVLNVAMAAGFGSLRRFNDLFKKRYRLAPTALRKKLPDAEKNKGSITVSLGYRPPYRWQKLLDFLEFRSIPGVEKVEGGEYFRTARFATGDGREARGWVRVAHQPENRTLAVSVDVALLPALPQVLSRVRHLFDLCCDPGAVHESLASMNAIKPGACVPGTRLPGSFDTFEMAVRAVLGQQITVKAARTLATRIVNAHGTPIQTGVDGLTHVFPSAGDIVALDGPIENHLCALGVTGARARTILELAKAFETGTVDFSLCAQPDAEVKKLMTLPGIGAWTAHYIAMRAMGWPDAFLETDYGVKKALAPRSSKEILALAENWRPWRGYATVNLWNTL